MKYSNREIRALLKKNYKDNTISDVQYVHYEMFVNDLLDINLQRDLNKRPIGAESGGEKWKN